MDGEPLRRLSGISARAGCSGRIQRQIHVLPVRASGRLVRDTRRPRPRELPQFLLSTPALAVLWPALGDGPVVKLLDGHAFPRHDAAFAHDVVTGLSSNPRTLPCKWLYDRRGAELFEEITGL